MQLKQLIAMHTDRAKELLTKSGQNFKIIQIPTFKLPQSDCNKVVKAIRAADGSIELFVADFKTMVGN